MTLTKDGVVVVPVIVFPVLVVVMLQIRGTDRGQETHTDRHYEHFHRQHRQSSNRTD